MGNMIELKTQSVGGGKTAIIQEAAYRSLTGWGKRLAGAPAPAEAIVAAAFPASSGPTHRQRLMTGTGRKAIVWAGMPRPPKAEA